MTPNEKTDRRLRTQLMCLGLLTVLPMCMISINGVNAMRGILYRELNQVSNSGSDAGTQDIPLRFEVPVAKDEAISSEAAIVDSATKTSPSSSLMFGVYDPENTFAKDRTLSLRHVYVSWIEFDVQSLTTKLRDIEHCGYRVFLTIEPWPVAEDTRQSLLPSIVAGKYDTAIDHLCGVLSSLQGPVYLSWGHEMDQDLTERYPWSAASPASFLEAYKYVVDRMRSQVSTPLNWVWAGVLKQGSLQYWPGSGYADFIGVPIYCYSIWDQKNYGHIRDFPTIFEEKLRLVKHLDMPLIITEMGVSGSPDFESFWLHQAFKHFADYPSLKAVLFFYARDTEGAWGKEIATPDWRVHPDSIRGLVNWTVSQRRMSNTSDESRSAVAPTPKSPIHDQK